MCHSHLFGLRWIGFTCKSGIDKNGLDYTDYIKMEQNSIFFPGIEFEYFDKTVWGELGCRRVFLAIYAPS